MTGNFPSFPNSSSDFVLRSFYIVQHENSWHLKINNFKGNATEVTVAFLPLLVLLAVRREGSNGKISMSIHMSKSLTAESRGAQRSFGHLAVTLQFTKACHGDCHMKTLCFRSIRTQFPWGQTAAISLNTEIFSSTPAVGWMV